MTSLEADLALNRMHIRASHAQLIRRARALLACKGMLDAPTWTPHWKAACALDLEMELGAAVERRATDLLERATDKLEEPRVAS